MFMDGDAFFVAWRSVRQWTFALHQFVSVAPVLILVAV